MGRCAEASSIQQIPKRCAFSNRRTCSVFVHKRKIDVSIILAKSIVGMGISPVEIDILATADGVLVSSSFRTHVPRTLETCGACGACGFPSNGRR